ncbi:MAG TPA: protein kinase [Polyangiales bacterium]|nr:protein kinase [Polyangiales bacterium]
MSFAHDYDTPGLLAAAAPAAVERGPRSEVIARGRYQMCLELASGGMGSVCLALYRGVDGFERVVALKRMHRELSCQTEYVQMFFDEAQLLARIRHPAVCSLLDLGQLDGTYFMAMEYLEGESLSSIRKALINPRQRQLRNLPRIAARVIARLAEGLHAVHEAQDDCTGKRLEAVHRDVTPPNLFVLHDGTVRLTDFGVARAQGMRHRTHGRVIKGNVGYIAPEQLTTSRTVDRRCDVWSLGVTLWELLTCRRLFDGAKMSAVVTAVVEQPIVAPSSINPHVPAALDAIVMRALERTPELRYQTARELALALERLLAASGDSVPAADVAAWLEELFPGRAAERRGLRALARAMAETLPAPSNRPPAQEPASVFDTQDTEPEMRDVHLVSTRRPPRRASQPMPPPSAAGTRAPPMRALIITVGVVLVLTISFLVMMWTQ